MADLTNPDGTYIKERIDYFKQHRDDTEHYEQIKETFAKNITYLMEIYGMTRREFGDLMGVKYSTVCEWTSGAFLPRHPYLEGMCRLFEKTYDELFEQDCTVDTEHDVVLEERLRELNSLIKEDENLLTDIENLLNLTDHEKYLISGIIRVLKKDSGKIDIYIKG